MSASATLGSHKEETRGRTYNGLPITQGGHKKKEVRTRMWKKKPQYENIMACPIVQGGHNQEPERAEHLHRKTCM